MIPHLIVFSEKHLQGRHWHIFFDIPNLSDVSLTWDGNISSFAILAGRWQFFRGRNFSDPVGPICGPGSYRLVQEIGIPDNAVSSIQLVDDGTGA